MMSNRATEAFLGGQGIPVELPQIESELEALWGPAAERAGGPDLDHPTVAKIVLANVVVSAFQCQPERLGPVLQDVVNRFPCRLIVLRTDESIRRQVRAEVSAVCNLPTAGRPQVCGERIILSTGPNELDLLPGAVRPLLESDLPFVLWWTDDPSEFAEVFLDLRDEATRALLDRPDPSADPRFLKETSACEWTRDATWYGATPWREQIAQLFDAPGTRHDLSRIRSLEIEAEASSRDRPPRVAVWLAAWLAGLLGWSPIDRDLDEDGSLQAQFQGPSGIITIAIRTRLNSHRLLAEIAAVGLTTAHTHGEGTFQLARSRTFREEIRVEVCSPTHCNLPRRVRSPELDAAHRVASALEARRRDGPYLKALPIALWLLAVE
jgi:glucose-6-phosphate dehydrogenase assembly protein OpcA